MTSPVGILTCVQMPHPEQGMVGGFGLTLRFNYLNMSVEYGKIVALSSRLYPGTS